MLETKCVGNNFDMLVTVLAVFVINILYILSLASTTNIQKMSLIFKFHHQHPKIVTNIHPNELVVLNEFIPITTRKLLSMLEIQKLKISRNSA